jgi:hypothetical protein
MGQIANFSRRNIQLIDIPVIRVKTTPGARSPKISLWLLVFSKYCPIKKSKAVSLHAMEVPGGRGGITRTHT